MIMNDRLDVKGEDRYMFKDTIPDFSWKRNWGRPSEAQNSCCV